MSNPPDTAASLIEQAKRPGKSLPFSTAGRRESGVLLHVTSLPGPYGIGDLGPAAFEWIDRLAAAHQSWWQILPLSPPGGSQSPYQCLSAFAGNPLLISPDALVADGLLSPDDLRTLPAKSKVDFKAATKLKTRLLRVASDNFRRGGSDELRRACDAFVQSQPWLADYALFIALRRSNIGEDWLAWPTAIKRRGSKAIAKLRHDLADEITFECFVQFVFARQLTALRRHAHRRGVGLIGDVPIFVSYDSADVWTHPHLFQLDAKLNPKAVAGVPPDAFAETGQRWNNPLYDWAAMAADDYAWWADRMAAAIEQTDAVRLDHFRGFDAYWRIPASAPTAMTGRWIDGPGEAVFKAIERRLGSMPLIAEDLGVITPRVVALRESLKLPGMRVIQFGFGGLTDSIHLPHRFDADCVAYTGTHDNDTTVGWAKTLTPPERKRFADYAGHDNAVAEPAWTLIRLAWASTAALSIVPIQDILGLPSTGRMNTPGTSTGNWGWRLPYFGPITPGMERLAKLTITYARV